jgi:hypothetical protein
MSKVDTDLMDRIGEFNRGGATASEADMKTLIDAFYDRLVAHPNQKALCTAMITLCITSRAHLTRIKQLEERCASYDFSLESLRQQVKAMESRGVEYKGVYAFGADYRRGDLVTRSGGLWCCMVASTKAQPGSSSDWVLAVKSGQSRNGHDRHEHGESFTNQPRVSGGMHYTGIIPTTPTIQDEAR